MQNLPRDGFVRILRDRKGRGGKTVTVIAGLSLPAAALASLTSELKRACGTGGTVRDDVIEIGLIGGGYPGVFDGKDPEKYAHSFAINSL